MHMHMHMHSPSFLDRYQYIHKPFRVQQQNHDHHHAEISEDNHSTDKVLAKRKTFLGPSLFHYYHKPLNIVEEKMQYLFNESGRR
ncbi:hypothetical protein Fmac_004294 [Flemingia macrophylla]|uniref:Uncharacterized protein n=1 Tax=Flemingia macrophylla TaxID=520843 RepID=A0ABD1N4H6_9FABA